MNTKFQAENSKAPRKSSISPWDSEDTFECMSPLRRAKIIHQQSCNQPNQIEVKLPQKKLPNIGVAGPDRPPASHFVVRKHHKTAPKSTVSMVLVADPTLADTPKFELNSSTLTTSTPTPTIRNDPVVAESKKLADSMIDACFPPLMTESCAFPVEPSIKTSTTPAPSKKRKTRNTLSNIRELLMDMKEHTTRSDQTTLNSHRLVHYNPENSEVDAKGHQRYVRRSWKSRQHTDYSIFERAL